MHLKNHTGRDVAYTVCYWLLLLVLLSAGFFLNLYSREIPLFHGRTDYQQPLWLFGEEGEPLKPVVLNERQVLEPGKSYTLVSDLTYDGKGDLYPTAMVSVLNLAVDTYYDEDLVFSFTEADKTIKRVRSMGYVIYPVSLGTHCLGKQLRFELHNTMGHPVTAVLPQVSFGDHATQVRELFFSCLPSMLISSAIAFAVLILVLLGNTLDGTQWTYVYFSAFAMLIVVYRTTQASFINYIWANPFMEVIGEYFSIAACPIPMLMSYRYRIKPFGQGACNLMISMAVLFLGVLNVLHFSGIMDVTHMVSIIHLWLLICSVFLLVIGHYIKCEMGGKLVFYKLVPILVGAMLDILFFYLTRLKLIPWSHVLSTGDFTGLALLVSLVLMIWEARKARLKAYQENERNKLLEKAVYTDSLTGVCNRAAFNRTVEAIRSGSNSGRSVTVMSADLNRLKQTNDFHGHAAGDELISQAASILDTCLQPYGSVYRVGGDEFVGILFDLPEDRREDIHSQILKRCGEKSVPVSLALGWAQLQGGDIDSCILRADQRMYEDKNRIRSREY